MFYNEDDIEMIDEELELLLNARITSTERYRIAYQEIERN